MRRGDANIYVVNDYCRTCGPGRFEVIIACGICTDETLALAQSRHERRSPSEGHWETAYIEEKASRSDRDDSQLQGRWLFVPTRLSTPLSEIDRALAVFEARADCKYRGESAAYESQIIRIKVGCARGMGTTFNALVSSVAESRLGLRSVAFKGFSAGRLSGYF